MKIAFFVSIVGDTNLAKATISKIVEQSSDPILIIPLTTTAIDRTKDLKDAKMISIVSIDEITRQTDLLAKDQISEQEVEAVKLFLEENGIQHAYFGAPSNNNEIPYQIARRLAIPFTLADEYMFKPEKLGLWKHVDELASKQNCHLAVPLKVVLTSQLASKLKKSIADSAFIIRTDVSGSDAAQAADKVTQAVPGALLNEATLKGKPSYFHEKTAKPYLPKTWSSENITTFFTAKPQSPHTKEELGLTDSAPDMLLKLTKKYIIN